MTPRILYVCDNRDDFTWGGRSASVALGQQIALHGELTSLGRSWAVKPIPTGKFTKRIDDNKYGGLVLRRSLNRAHVRRALRVLPIHADYLHEDPRRSAEAFEAAADTHPALNWLRDQFKATDAVVINGEGSLVFFPEGLRRDVRFQLFAIEMAANLGKPVGFINALAGEGPATHGGAAVERTVRRSLERCTVVSARDPTSRQRLLDIGLTDVRIAPDALFTWAPRYRRFFDSDLGREWPELYESWPESDRFLQTPAHWPNHYLCVAGASRYPGQDTRRWAPFFEAVVSQLQSRIGLDVVLCDSGGDSFLEEVARRTGSIYIAPPVNLLMASYMLANAAGFVSGRFHPTVMASLGGTPCTMLESQAHKTLSVQEQLGYPQPRVFPIGPLGANVAAVASDLEAKVADGEKLRGTIRGASHGLSDQASYGIRESVEALLDRVSSDTKIAQRRLRASGRLRSISDEW